MRIVLLGGAGFIGQHFAKQCRDTADVVVVSRHAPQDADRLAGVDYVQGDCASVDVLRGVIREGDYVVFLAYNSVPKTSFDDPLRDIQENLPLAISLLTVLREVPVSRLLYVSSGGTVYGPAGSESPIEETHTTHPISPYGITKLAIENYCNMYSRLFGIPVVVARPANPFGPGQIPYRGQGFVATAMAKILRDEEITVFGPTGTYRDYLYVEDLVSAMKILLQADTRPGEIFNIGSEIGLNNLQVLSAISACAGIALDDLKIDFLPARHFDVAYNVLSSGKLKRLGWQPTVGFDAALITTMEWLTEHLRNT